MLDPYRCNVRMSRHSTGLTLGVLGVDWEPPWSPALLWSAGFSEPQKGDLWGLQGAAWWQTWCLSNQMIVNNLWQRDINTVAGGRGLVWSVCAAFNWSLETNFCSWQKWCCNIIKCKGLVNQIDFRYKYIGEMFLFSGCSYGHQLLIWPEKLQTYSSNVEKISQASDVIQHWEFFMFIFCSNR